ncbi:flavin-containing monooxygenase [Nitrosospira multiformis]|uniref:flavin-containing monooxygenase n=1 Tax=Nitrosospira multiformis TaxID=1231 RepID=UPI0008965118|nr:NAD(P)/FAD-dependent oxidoreductase [Nitrosospira multiformis]SDZ84176.1 Predicted flavoprotein CzcO associated with the cation diffusion facilitator CzcD [Nitrosospira multiformis]
MSNEPSVLEQGAAEIYRAVILGAGVSGLCMGKALRKAGITSFLIIEKSAGIGGTWWDNTYPGAECDVRSHLYSYSFDLNPDWSQAYAPQPEIRKYLVRFATKFDLLSHIRLNAALTSARFDAEQGLWLLRLENGEQLKASFFICSAGPLSEPRYPDIPGMDTYEGRLFHSARWDHDYPLNGKRVAVVGTAASAVQIIPHIAPLAARLYVCQRSPNWIIPRLNHVYAPWEKALFRLKPIAKTNRFLLYWLHEMNRLSFNPGGFMARIGRELAEWHLRRQVIDPRLRGALRPGYPFGCKRVLLSNDYYPTLMRPNVELIDTPIDRIDRGGIVTRDGQKREVDVIICATGFNVKRMLSVEIRGLQGYRLNEAWAREPKAYQGVTVASFPNLFILLGPNTGQGHTSAILFIEAQVNYALKCIQEIARQQKRFLSVKPEAMNRYNEELQKTLSTSVWAAGCRSWYKTESGKIIGIYPGFSFQYAKQLREPRFEDYVMC